MQIFTVPTLVGWGSKNLLYCLKFYSVVQCRTSSKYGKVLNMRKMFRLTLFRELISAGFTCKQECKLRLLVYNLETTIVKGLCHCWFILMYLLQTSIYCSLSVTGRNLKLNCKLWPITFSGKNADYRTQFAWGSSQHVSGGMCSQEK